MGINSHINTETSIIWTDLLNILAKSIKRAPLHTQKLQMNEECCSNFERLDAKGIEWSCFRKPLLNNLDSIWDENVSNNGIV